MDKTASLPAMRTVCVGRYLIDMPAEFQQTPGSDVELTYGLDKNFRTVKVQVPRLDGREPSFDSVVSKRSIELSKREHFESPSKTMLAFQQRFSNSIVLIRSYKSPRMLDSFLSEYFAEIGSTVGLFSERVHVGEQTDPVEAKVLKVVQQTSLAALPDQAGKGACMGPLVIDAGQDGESFTLTFLAKKWPDAGIEIFTNSLLAESDGGLLKRWETNSKLFDQRELASSTLRRGKVTIDGRAAEELLLSGQDHQHNYRSFLAETMLTKPSTFAQPSFTLRMTMGGQIDGEYVDASLSDSEAVAMWDAIVKSIRLRPGAL